MAGLLKFLAVFYARETVGTISRGGTARSPENEESERARGDREKERRETEGEKRGTRLVGAGYGRGESHATLGARV